MKKLTYFRLILLAVLAASGVLMSCNTVDPERQNPDYNAQTDEVTTNFVLSVSTGGSVATKMTPDNVQANPEGSRTQKFWGIDSAKIVLYTTPISADYTPFVGTGSTFKKSYSLGNLYSSSDIVPENNASSSSRRVLKLSVPTTVSTALFYGKAAGNGAGSAARGYLWGNVENDYNDTWFHGVPRLQDVAAYDATGRFMIYVINKILATSVQAQSAGATYEFDYEGQHLSYTGLPALSWRQLGEAYAAGEDLDNPLGEGLAKAYADFVTIPATEYRAGSSAAIKAQMQAIYLVVESALNAKPTSDKEANARRLAREIETTMNRYFTNAWEYKGYDELTSGANPVIPAADITAYNLSGAGNINNYPESFNIPAGAAQIVYDSATGTMSYLDPNRPLVNQANDYFYPYQYYYPLEIAYYTNSAIRTTDKSNVTMSDFPNGTNPWLNSTIWTSSNWTYPSSVVSTTTGVAIANNIHYGVAMLETVVKYSDDWLEDNRSARTGDATNRRIELADADIALTGVLVGGVCPKLNWQFLRRDASKNEHNDGISFADATKYPNYDSSKFDNVVYDNAVNETIPSDGGETNPNFTIVPDNYNSSATNQNDVYVALEFKNNGDAFWGKHNVIGSGMKFYLVAKLVHNPDGQTITWPTEFQIPPLYTAAEGTHKPGDSMQIPRVFIQDYVTKAVFKISKYALQNAYVSMPDMSQAQMSLGLSVDITWQNGFVYDIDFATSPF